MLAEKFTALDRVLTATRQYWQCIAFEQQQLPWPHLHDALLQLSEGDLMQLDADDAALIAHFTPFIKELSELPDLLSVTPAAAHSDSDIPFWLANGIKGRKLNQIQQFVAQAGPFSAEDHVLEWCAGKGHLGRAVAHQCSSQVHSVEIQQSLCEQGAQLAKEHDLAMSFTQADVLHDDTSNVLKQCNHALALHACGGLHQKLMRSAVEHSIDKLSISPCCYHLFQEQPRYQVMSQQAQASTLELSSHDLKLALQQTVTAPGRVRRLRQQELHWRLAFDLILRTHCGTQSYTPVPSVGKEIFSSSFADFCQWAAQKKGFNLPDNVDYDAFLQQALARKRITERVELVRHIFRRAIEMWLVLDRALYLQEQGYVISVSTFCESQITPRNILIKAQRRSEPK